MPRVLVVPIEQQDGTHYTEFSELCRFYPVTYTFKTAQQNLDFWNNGRSNITLVISGTTVTVKPGQLYKSSGAITEFTVSTNDYLGTPFTVEAWETSGGTPTGGGGITVYDTLTSLQNALPGGSTSPVWVTADNCWYYWTGTVTPTLPSTPATPTATAGNNQVALAWGAISGATSYKVYRGGTLIASPASASYTDTTAVNGTAYSYTVSAVNSAGESAQSSAASATPAAPSTAPAVPTGLTATAGNAKVDLAWGAVTGASSYKLYRGDTLLASPTTNNYSDTTAVNGTAYLYTVSAVNGVGESAQSTAATATPMAPTLTIVAADSFTGADGTALSGRATETGAKVWSLLGGGGTWQITGNQAVLTGSGSDSLLAIDSGKSDGTVTVKMPTGGSNNNNYMRLYCRVSDFNNCVFLQASGGDGYEVYKKVGGTYTKLIVLTGPKPAIGDTVKMSMNGSTIGVSINGAAEQTTTCADHVTATKQGLGATTTAGATDNSFDDFEVRG